MGLDPVIGAGATPSIVHSGGSDGGNASGRQTPPQRDAPVEPRAAPPEPEDLPGAVTVAVGRQDSLARLFAILDASLKSKFIPTPIKALIDPIFATHAPFGPDLTPRQFRQSLALSGLFFEQDLGRTGSPQVGDLKGQLARLLAALEPLALEARAQQMDAPRPLAASSLMSLSDYDSEMTPEPSPAAVSAPFNFDAQIFEGSAPEGSVMSPALLSQLLAAHLAAAESPAKRPRPRSPLQPPHGEGRRAPPPALGAPMLGQWRDAAGLSDAETEAAALGRLTDSVRAALARISLFQLASAPDRKGGAHWRFEAPIQVASGAAVVEIEINRDDQGPSHLIVSDHAHWRARFQYHPNAATAVEGDLRLGPTLLRLSLWVEGHDLISQYTSRKDLFELALRHALQPFGIHDIAVRILSGPRAVERPSGPEAPSPGRLIDRST